MLFCKVSILVLLFLKITPAHLPLLATTNSEKVNVPGLTPPLAASSLLPPLSDPNHPFTKLLVTNFATLSRSKGIIINSFDWFERENLEAINNGLVSASLPPVLPIGPLIREIESEEKEEYIRWLDEQKSESAVYVSFGSRTAMSRDQIRELAEGLEKSGERFLWVLKTSKVDREDKEEIGDLLGEGFLVRTEGKGLVVRDWVRQERILGHRGVGAFVSHCGWNSVTEAARMGVRVVAWPQHGDQKMNAEVIEAAGLGKWERSWGWGGELIGGDEIREKIREIMRDERLKEMSKKVGEEANKALGFGGTSDKAIKQVSEYLKERDTTD